MAGWGRTDQLYQQRIGGLTGAAQDELNGPYYLKVTKVIEDGEIDALFGKRPGTNAGLDWYFAHLATKKGDGTGDTLDADELRGDVFIGR